MEQQLMLMQQRSTEMFGQANVWFRSRVESIRISRLENQFKEQIKSIIVLANTHKAKGVELGDPIYAELYSRAEIMTEGFCKLTSRSYEEVLTGSPALNQLKGWAEYDAQAEHIKKFKQVFFIIIGGAMGTGIIGGIVAISYHALTFWFAK
jgi:hypothetical protein